VGVKIKGQVLTYDSAYNIRVAERVRLHKEKAPTPLAESIQFEPLDAR